MIGLISIMRGFNPRARGGRDFKDDAYVSTSSVSIHAPAGGATTGTVTDKRAIIVSIHAPAGGATFKDDAYVSTSSVSIHAPAGGATS